MNVLNIRIPTKQAAEVAGMKETTLQTWMRRKEVGRGGNDTGPVEGGGSQGAHRLWSFPNIMEIAIANALVDGGVNLDLALLAGATFAYSGAMPNGGAVNYPATAIDLAKMRQPGFPFYDPSVNPMWTYAFVSVNGTAVLGGGQDYDPHPDAMITLGRPMVLTRLDCNEVFFRACNNLNIVPLTALRQVYGDATD